MTQFYSFDDAKFKEALEKKVHQLLSIFQVAKMPIH